MEVKHHPRRPVRPRHHRQQRYRVPLVDRQQRQREATLADGRGDAAADLQHRAGAAGRPAAALEQHAAESFRHLLELRPDLSRPGHGLELKRQTRNGTRDEDDNAAWCAEWIADDRRKAFFADIGAGCVVIDRVLQLQGPVGLVLRVDLEKARAQGSA